MIGTPIECFFHSDQTTQFKELGLEHPMTDCDIRKITFYHITAMSPYIDKQDENREYGCIHSGTEEFITIYSPQTLKDIINGHTNGQ